MDQLMQCLQQQAHSMLFYLLPLLLSLVVLVLWRKSETNKYRLPPSPPRLPVIGNLHQLHGRLSHRALHSLARKYGPLMLLHFGRVPTLVVSSADIARDVFKTHDHIFASRPDLEFPKRLLYAKDIAFSPYGEYWRQVRKVCVLQLLSAKKVQSFQPVREEEVALLMEKIKESSSPEVNLSDMFVSLASNLICRVAFGRTYNDGQGGKKFKHMVEELMYLLGIPSVRDMIPWLGWVNHLNGLNSRVEKNFQELDSFLDKVVEEHIEKQQRYGDDGGESEEEDFVDVLLGIGKDGSLGFPMERDSIKAIILDMFSAGIDTSSVTLEWAISELLRHPEIMKEVQREVRSASRGNFIMSEVDLEKMVYLKSVIKETLRLHPPVPLLVPHESMEHVKLQGYDIPAKTTIMINAFTIGRDPVIWDEPEKFYPSRFLTGKTSAIDFKGQSFELVPFGAGRRGCPGIVFATSMLEIVLANLLDKFNWELPNGADGKDLDMDERLAITIHRKTDLIIFANPYYK